MGVAFVCKSGSPYFACYTCPDYYFAVAAPGGFASFGGPFETEKFRSAVSQTIGTFLVKCLKDTLKVDASQEIVSFSHNRAHTNVLAYISSMGSWAPIQHNDADALHQLLQIACCADIILRRQSNASRMIMAQYNAVRVAVQCGFQHQARVRRHR